MVALSTNCNSLLNLAVVLLSLAINTSITYVESFQLQNSFLTRVYHQSLTTTSTSYKSYRSRQLYSENPREEEIVGDQYEGMYDLHSCL